MNTLFSLTTVIAAVMAVGSIEDCGGHCMGNDNWTMFFIMSGIMLISGYLSLITMKGNK